MAEWADVADAYSHLFDGKTICVACLKDITSNPITHFNDNRVRRRCPIDIAYSLLQSSGPQNRETLISNSHIFRQPLTNIETLFSANRSLIIQTGHINATPLFLNQAMKVKLDNIDFSLEVKGVWTEIPKSAAPIVLAVFYGLAGTLIAFIRNGLLTFLPFKREGFETVDAIDCPTVWRGIVDTLREKLLSTAPLLCVFIRYKIYINMDVTITHIRTERDLVGLLSDPTSRLQIRQPFTKLTREDTIHQAWTKTLEITDRSALDIVLSQIDTPYDPDTAGLPNEAIIEMIKQHFGETQTGEVPLSITSLYKGFQTFSQTCRSVGSYLELEAVIPGLITMFPADHFLDMGRSLHGQISRGSPAFKMLAGWGLTRLPDGFLSQRDKQLAFALFSEVVLTKISYLEVLACLRDVAIKNDENTTGLLSQKLLDVTYLRYNKMYGSNI